MNNIQIKENYCGCSKDTSNGMKRKVIPPPILVEGYSNPYKTCKTGCPTRMTACGCSPPYATGMPSSIGVGDGSSNKGGTPLVRYDGVISQVKQTKYDNMNINMPGAMVTNSCAEYKTGPDWGSCAAKEYKSPCRMISHDFLSPEYNTIPNYALNGFDNNLDSYKHLQSRVYTIEQQISLIDNTIRKDRNLQPMQLLRLTAERQALQNRFIKVKQEISDAYNSMRNDKLLYHSF